MTHADAYRRDDPDRRFLQSREWRERLRPRQLEAQPLCEWCLSLGQIAPAAHVDHVRRPRGDRTLQRSPQNFQSLCVNHHGLKSAWERQGHGRPLVIGSAVDGWSVTWHPDTGIVR